MKKATIILLIAAVTAVGCVFFHYQGQNKPCPPERITLYLSDKKEIITLGYKEYLVGCLLGLDIPSSGQAALNAAACAISSTVIHTLQSNDGGTLGAQLSDKQHRWVSVADAQAIYTEGFQEYLHKAQKAAEYGMTHILTYQNTAICAPLCRYSTGLTDSGGYPYLSETAVDFDANAEEAISKRAFSAEKVLDTMTALTGISALGPDRSKWFSAAVYEKSGTLREVRFGGARVTGAKLREAFGLRSAAITIEYSEDRFVFASKGWGDNMGMSINAAAIMARMGSTAEEILHFFFPSAEIQKL